MTLLAMNRPLFEKKDNDGYLWPEEHTFNAVCYEDNYFPKRNSNYLIVFLFSIGNMFVVIFGV